MAIQYDVNQTPTTGAEAIVQLVTVLSGASWSVHAFGDGSTRSTGSLPDATQLGNSSAWVAMKAPSGDHTITFQRGSDNTRWWCAYAFGGLSTDGNGTTVDSPTTVGDLKDFFNNGSTATPGTLFPADNALGAFRFNVVAYDSSPYSWVAVAWNISSGEARTLLYFDGATTNITDPAKYVLCGQYRSGSPWSGTRDFLSHTSVSPLRSWVAKGFGGQSWVLTVAAFYSSTDGVVLFPRTLAVNPFDSKDDLAPVVYVTKNSSTYQFKGVGSLFLWCGYSRSTGDTFDITGETDDRVVVGDVAFPWPHGIAALV